MDQASLVVQTVKNLQFRRTGLDPWDGRSPGEGNGYPLQYSFLENSMDRGVWQATVQGFTDSWTPLSSQQHVGQSLLAVTSPLPSAPEVSWDP